MHNNPKKIRDKLRIPSLRSIIVTNNLMTEGNCTRLKVVEIVKVMVLIQKKKGKNLNQSKIKTHGFTSSIMLIDPSTTTS